MTTRRGRARVSRGGLRDLAERLSAQTRLFQWAAHGSASGRDLGRLPERAEEGWILAGSVTIATSFIVPLQVGHSSTSALAHGQCHPS
jgi:hypothetical protein